MRAYQIFDKKDKSIFGYNRIMKFFKFTRYTEWWEYKLVPLLTIGYAVIYLNNYPFDHAILRLLFLLLSIIIGAVYVSIINDVTDIEEDASAGKKNRMADLAPWKRISLVALSILLGLFFACQIYPDKISLFFYSMAWVVFSLYSIPPVRLKKRRIWGVFCDASGAHLFPTLLIIYNLAFVFGTMPNTVWAVSAGVWAISCGLRGILWHQFSDRDNDIASGTTTFASHVKPENFKIQEIILFIIEIGAFALLLSYVFNLLILLSLFLYFLLVLIRKFSFGNNTTLIIPPKNGSYQILMNDYYLVFFPLCLLIMIALRNNYGWIVLCCHLILFPQKTIFIAKHYISFLKSKLG